MSRLALSMIVRDAAESLSACLESVKAVVDELCIADTGSADNTIEIAHNFGARVISIPWNNDFAEARNRALVEVQADWVLSLDADEVLDPSAGQRLPALLGDSSCAGYQVTIRNYVLSSQDRLWDRPAKPNDSLLEAARPYPAYVEHENVRLFRRDPELYFVGRVHESVGPRILETGRKLGIAGFVIHHFGLAADQETRARKNHFYRELGRQKIREMPSNAQAHLELGLVEFDNFGNLKEAQSLFERACRLNPRFGSAWFFYGLTLLKLDRPLEALHCFEKAEQVGHRTALLSESRGDALYNLARFREAVESYEIARGRDLRNPEILAKLGLATLRSGKFELGLQLMRRAVETMPEAPSLHDRLILGLVWLARIEDAAQAARQKLNLIGHPQPSDFLRGASLWAKLQNWPEALTTLQEGLALYPKSSELQHGLSEVQHATALPKMALT